LGNNDYTYDDWNLKNAQIASFSLSNDSIAGLANVIFTIDQVNGKIFNKDSMPFGTVIDEKVLCNMTFEIYSTGVLIMPQATGDTINWTGSTSDSIDFSQPVLIKVYAPDNETTKTYEAQINVHQVNPDSMVWNKFLTIAEGHTFKEMKVVETAGSYCVFAKENDVVKLFKSEISALEFSEIALTGFPENAVLSSITEYHTDLFVTTEEGTVYTADNWAEWLPTDMVGITTILGVLPKNSLIADSVLCCIQNVNSTLKFCTYNPAKIRTTGDDVPEDFPVTGFSNVTYEIMYYPHLIIASGRDRSGNLTHKAWDTMDGLMWAPLTNEKMPFADSEGASIARYDNLLFLIGGLDMGGNAISETYFSKDNGVTWNDTIFFPDEYQSKAFSTLIVDKDKYMLLFGGKTAKDGNMVNELWRGRINRFGFKED
jgi:hypothetical protein